MSTIKEFDENEAIKAMRASLPEGGLKYIATTIF